MLKTLLASLVMFGAFVTVALWGGQNDASRADNEGFDHMDRGVLISATEPGLDDEDLAAVSRLPRVSTLDELKASLDSDVLVIIIDESSLEALPTEFLAEQVRKGRSLIGLNITIQELIAKASFYEVVKADSIRGTVPWDESTFRGVERPMYSYINKMPDGSEMKRVTANQLAFTDGLFKAHLEHHLTGINADVGVDKIR